MIQSSGNAVPDDGEPRGAPSDTAPDAVIASIRAGVASGLARLAPPYRARAEAHLKEPCPIRARLRVESDETETFWLVTDDTGSSDSSYRVVFDPETGAFGLIMGLMEGGDLFLGGCGDFADAVRSM